jgi:hypothetical protein
MNWKIFIIAVSILILALFLLCGPKPMPNTISTLGVLAAFLAALFAALSANETRKTTQAQLMATMLDQYAEDNMLKAIRSWKDFVCSSDEDHVPRYIKEEEEKTDLYKDLDQKRRLISHFFLKVSRLYDKKLIDKKVVESVSHKEKVEFVKYIIEPIEREIHPKLYERYDFEILQKFHNINKPHPVTNENIRKYINENL